MLPNNRIAIFGFGLFVWKILTAFHRYYFRNDFRFVASNWRATDIANDEILGIWNDLSLSPNIPKITRERNFVKMFTQRFIKWYIFNILDHATNPLWLDQFFQILRYISINEHIDPCRPLGQSMMPPVLVTNWPFYL